MKILVIRFSSIGDIVLTTPVVRALKQQLPDVRLHFLTKPAYADIMANNPHVDQVHTLKSLATTLSEIRKEKFDVIIDLHKNLRTLFLKFLTPGKKYSYDKLNWQKWLMVNLKINQLPSKHIVDRYMAAVSDLGVTIDEEGLDYFIPDKDEVENDWLPPSHRQGYVAVAIGGQHATKQLPKDRLIELCDRINRPVVLLGGKTEAPLGEVVEQFFTQSSSTDRERILEFDLGKKARVYNGCGKFNLNQSASIISNATVVFSHDTGLMHIAAAFQKDIFSIWGNTIPEFGMYPYRTKFTIFENRSLSCRPCSKIGYQKCPKGHFKCMREVKFDFYLPE
ncbi:MAG: glycosyltransferase family 9 protein [Bacteroidota bacterium]